MAYLTNDTKNAMAALVASLKWHTYKFESKVRLRDDRSAPPGKDPPKKDPNELDLTHARHTLVRWAECPHPDNCVGLVDYLTMDECLEALKVSGLTFAEGDLRPTLAWFEQDDDDTQRQGQPRKYKIYHALRARTDETFVDGPHVLNNGCRSKTTAWFYWNVDEIPACPDSSSGIDFRLNVSGRSEEDGTYDCVITMTENVPYDGVVHDSEQDWFKTVTRQEFLGVKGDKPLEAIKTDLKKEDEKGTTVQIGLRKNEDCTHDVTIVNEVKTARKDVQDHIVEGAVTTVKTTTDFNQETKKTDSSNDTVAYGRNPSAEAVKTTTLQDGTIILDDISNKKGSGIKELTNELTENGKYTTTARERTAYKWLKGVTLSPDRNGEVRRRYIFKNVTNADLQTIGAHCNEISFDINEFGLHDGTGTRVLIWGASGGNDPDGTIRIDNFDQYIYSSNSSYIEGSEDGKRKPATIFTLMQIRQGCVRDHHIQAGTANNPYERVNGCLRPSVTHKGQPEDGYWMYSGICWRVEFRVEDVGGSTGQAVTYIAQETGTRVTSSTSSNVAPWPTGAEWDLYKNNKPGFTP